ncbi:hypothetical protein YC2023_115390 [Brassica napus]
MNNKLNQNFRIFCLVLIFTNLKDHRQFVTPSNEQETKDTAKIQGRSKQSEEAVIGETKTPKKQSSNLK